MRNRRILTIPAALFFAILTIGFCCPAIEAQDNSYAHMLNVTMTASQNLFIAQTSVNRQRESMRTAARQPAHESTAPRQPQAAQYPITATDFQPISSPIMPDQFANSATGVDQPTRETMRTLFRQVLASYEAKARKDNFAHAITFACAAALKVRNGKEPSNSEVDRMIADFNNRLAASPTYYAFTPLQQQMLYESLIIIGGIVVFLDYQGKQTNNPQMQAQAQQMSSAVLKAFLGI